MGVTECRSNKVMEEQSMNLARSFRDLKVYQNGLVLLIEIFEVTKRFPAEERYSLTDQIRRSSRSICANISEAWRKRRYKPAFISKLSDAETEGAETQVWLDVALVSGYVTNEEFQKLDAACDRVIGQLVRMIDQADRWILPTADTPRPRHSVTPPPPRKKT
jgi:four helix bundle protein